jgi:hypothetical protein
VGLRFRRSVQLIPGVRLNLSGGGASVSLGGRGFHYTVGPKGTRVTVGLPGTGLSWTQYTPHARHSSGGAVVSHRSPGLPAVPIEPKTEGCALVPIESAPTNDINAFSTSELAPILNRVHRRARLAPLIAIMNAGLFIGALAAGDQILIALAALYTAVFTPIGVYLDRYRRSVKVGYQPEGPAKKIAEALSESFSDLRQCRAIWSIRSEGHTSDWKRNAGAGTLVKRQRIYLQQKAPACVRGGVTFPSIAIGADELFFLPDAVLLVTPGSVAALHYRDLALSSHPKRFIEEDTVPGDATIVDQTWRFVAKNGGPDRRFNGNRQLPVCLYGEMDFGSAGGLRGKIQFSNSSAGDRFVKIIAILASLGSPGAKSKSIVALKEPARTPAGIFCCCSILLAGTLGLATLGAWSARPPDRTQTVAQPQRTNLGSPKTDTKTTHGASVERKRASVEPNNRLAGEPIVITPQSLPISADTPRTMASVPLPRPRPRVE